MSATSADVEVALLRPLSEVETAYVPALLEKALRVIAREVGSLDDADAGFLDTVTDVQAEMVARRLRNPDGVRSEGDGQYQYSLDGSLASGKLELTDGDRKALGIYQGLMVVNLSFGG